MSILFQNQFFHVTAQNRSWYTLQFHDNTYMKINGAKNLEKQYEMLKAAYNRGVADAQAGDNNVAEEEVTAPVVETVSFPTIKTKTKDTPQVQEDTVTKKQPTKVVASKSVKSEAIDDPKLKELTAKGRKLCRKKDLKELRNLCEDIKDAGYDSKSGIMDEKYDALERKLYAEILAIENYESK